MRRWTTIGPARIKKEVAFARRCLDGDGWPDRAGGDVLFIEAPASGGNKNFILTGQSQVLQESPCRTQHVRQRQEMGIFRTFANTTCRARSRRRVPKDGPSAGVTMATAILWRRGTTRAPGRAMTGESRCRGWCCPWANWEKTLAARRFGVRTVIMPALNEPDLSELPEEIRRDMTFVPVETLEQVIKVALDEKAP